MIHDIAILFAVFAPAADAAGWLAGGQRFLQDLPEVVHVKPRKHHHPRPPAAHGAAAGAAVAHAAAAAPLRLAQGRSSSRLAPAPQVADRDVRPSAGGRPTIVGFGMYVKQFFNADCKDGAVMIDLVLSLKWWDNRTTTLVPHGQGEVTLRQDRAAALMWMPNVFITNSDLNSTQVTSTAVTVFSSGSVFKVQRLLTAVKHSCDIRAFPFDEQLFAFRVASTTLMADELQLLPLAEEGLSGAKEGIFAGQEFEFVNTTTRSFLETDGNLRKSRGELVIQVRRVSEPYIKTLLVPSLILVTLGYCVFLMPLAPPFVMPRVSTSIISFLALLFLSLKTSNLLPVRGSESWIDVFEESCTMMIFTSLSLNIFVEVIEHEFKLGAVAKMMQMEIRCGLPVVEIVVVCICFFRTDGTTLWWLNLFTKLWFFGILIPYVVWSVTRIVVALRGRAAEEGK